MTARLNIPGLQQSLRMQVHEQGDQYVSRAIRENGIWEPYETQLIINALKDAKNFVDVGANIGYYSVIAGAILEDASGIYGFEPEPRNFSLLQANMALNGFSDAVCVNAGLAAESQKLQMYLSDDNWGDHQIYDRGEVRSSVEVALINGADFLGARIDAIDVLKIDTQGAEFQVISGLEPLIRQSLPDIKMVIEFWPFGLKKAGSHGHALLDLLLSFELPIAIIDHIEHRLIPCVESDLRPWIDSLDEDATNEGFLNLYLGARE